MEIVIYENEVGGKNVTLTTDSPQSHYGIPVLRYENFACPDFGPADMLPDFHPEFDGQLGIDGVSAAEIVILFALREADKLSGNKIKFIDSFLRQWPVGPQVKTYRKLREKLENI